MITDFLKTTRSPAEQLQEFLEHLVDGKPLKQDTVDYIESLRAP